MRSIIAALILLSCSAWSQPLRDLNFNYLYNGGKEGFILNMRFAYHDNTQNLYFEFQSTNASKSTSEYSIAWEIRKEISDKEGSSLPEPEWLESTETKKTGRIKLDSALAGQLVVSKVIYSAARTAWYFYKTIPTGRTFALLRKTHLPDGEGTPVMEPYVLLDEWIQFTGPDADKPFQILYYNDEFPAAAPPFSITQQRVSKTIQADSTFITNPKESIWFSFTGLFLVQHDTTSAEGLAFRVEDDYPKLGRLESLIGPLIYVCTNSEIDKLHKAGSDKKQFDRIILSITGSEERAKTFIRNYFRRVEQANSLFSSYKEGWKTDRGMVYIICGLPDEVYLLGDREVWEYKRQTFKERFTFVKSSTLFDPDNFVLVRDKKFKDEWYELIDLWRKARF